MKTLYLQRQVVCTCFLGTRRYDPGNWSCSSFWFAHLANSLLFFTCGVHYFTQLPIACWLQQLLWFQITDMTFEPKSRTHILKSVSWLVMQNLSFYEQGLL